ncbi:hypothetical protein CERZMDRAFT_93063 [Cercospora zeae-maydis SCOH1-5]|uniref:Uncharacterized protein n=1 Tax=Cercospora zeae-maydis SCOH1-5 TaxID=717836 RepID=A0A6A6FUE3_9PEZI|nr:hypothetical protein CERZMDRAFT_93063 [Cercospora zeae-maydis SCOH1-5]
MGFTGNLLRRLSSRRRHEREGREECQDEQQQRPASRSHRSIRSAFSTPRSSISFPTKTSVHTRPQSQASPLPHIYTTLPIKEAEEVYCDPDSKERAPDIREFRWYARYRRQTMDGLIFDYPSSCTGV